MGMDLIAETKLWVSQAISDGRPGDAPLVTNETIVTGTGDGAVIALDVESGSQRWRQSIETKHAFSPAVSDTTAYVTDSDGRLYALDLKTGDIIETIRAESVADLPGLAIGNADCSPVISEDAIHFVGPDGVLVTVDQDDFASGVERHRTLQHRLAAPPTVVENALFADALPTVYGYSI
ncbi:hypothetical protein GCM10009067_41100 [Haloarcula sebkhae]|nr:hypothetical protein GCM10009067_41100 [Haloarcula sebkhae]